MATPAPVPIRPPEPETPCARIERQLELLGELAEAGLEVARAIERQACGEGLGPREAGEVALAYARVSRAVRQTVLLQSKLMHDLKAEAFVEAQGARLARRETRESPPPRPSADERPGAPSLEAAEGLEPLEDYDDLLDEPFEEAVARICRDLGLPTSRITSASQIAPVYPVANAMASGEPFAGPGVQLEEASSRQAGRRQPPGARGSDSS